MPGRTIGLCLRIKRLRLRSPSAARQLEASLPPLAFAYDAAETRRNPRSDDSLDDNCDDNCCPSDAAYTTISNRSCLVTASARSWQCGGQGAAREAFRRTRIRRPALDTVAGGN